MTDFDLFDRRGRFLETVSEDGLDLPPFDWAALSMFGSVVRAADGVLIRPADPLSRFGRRAFPSVADHALSCADRGTSLTDAERDALAVHDKLERPR
jgi:hypothetical protein